MTRTTPRAAASLPQRIINTLATVQAENFTAGLRAGPSAPSADEVEFIAAVKRTQKDLQRASISGRRQLTVRDTKISGSSSAAVKKKNAKQKNVGGKKVLKKKTESARKK